MTVLPEPRTWQRFMLKARQQKKLGLFRGSSLLFGLTFGPKNLCDLFGNVLGSQDVSQGIAMMRGDGSLTREGHIERSEIWDFVTIV